MEWYWIVFLFCIPLATLLAILLYVERVQELRDQFYRTYGKPQVGARQGRKQFPMRINNTQEVERNGKHHSNGRD